MTKTFTTIDLLRELQHRLTNPAALVETLTAVELFDDLLRRVGYRDDIRRDAAMSVAELLRRAEDWDAARARHPGGKPAGYFGPYDDPEYA